MNYCNQLSIVLSLLASSYLIGSIPFGYIMMRFFAKKDIRTIGSGNIGATNVIRSGNKILGIITWLLDSTKGLFFVIFVDKTIINRYIYTEFRTELILLIGFFAILGHVFSIFMKFKGGKGVATSSSIYLYINLYVGLSFFICWILVFLKTRVSSLSAICAFLASLCFSISLKIYSLIPTSHIVFFISVTILIIFTHRSNIVRLILNNELKI